MESENAKGFVFRELENVLRSFQIRETIEDICLYIKLGVQKLDLKSVGVLFVDIQQNFRQIYSH